MRVDDRPRVKVESRGGSPARRPGATELIWTDVLVRMAQDPAQVAWLHGIIGPYCHQSRNLLNGLKIGLYIARRKDDDPVTGVCPRHGSHWDELDRAYRAVEERLDRLQSLCRPLELAPVRLPLSLLMEERRGRWIDTF